MTKNFNIEGKYRTVSGYIRVLMKYRSDIKTVHNRGTHDDMDKLIHYNKVECYINNTLYKSSPDFTSDEEIESICEKFEEEIRKEMERLSDTPVKKSIKEILELKGYK